MINETYLEEIIAIVEFLGDEITVEQLRRLVDKSKKLSIADRERLYETLNGGPLFTEISMNRAEMGGYHRY